MQTPKAATEESETGRETEREKKDQVMLPAFAVCVRETFEEIDNRLLTSFRLVQRRVCVRALLVDSTREGFER